MVNISIWFYNLNNQKKEQTKLLIAELEMEQIGQKPVSIWEVGVTGSSLMH